MVKVLIVDDDHDLLEMVGFMLDTPKMEAVCVGDCKEVLSVLEVESPHVLVMDIFLGECDGRTLCKQVKSMEKYSLLPILLYSAGQITEASLKECDADDFITKPFEMVDLLSRIEKLANR